MEKNALLFLHKSIMPCKRTRSIAASECRYQRRVFHVGGVAKHSKWGRFLESGLAAFYGLLYSQPRRMSHFSISTATNTTEDRARHKASSPGPSGSVLKMGLSQGT